MSVKKTSKKNTKKEAASKKPAANKNKANRTQKILELAKDKEVTRKHIIEVIIQINAKEGKVTTKKSAAGLVSRVLTTHNLADKVKSGSDRKATKKKKVVAKKKSKK